MDDFSASHLWDHRIIHIIFSLFTIFLDLFHLKICITNENDEI